jgi:hypothetical protein
LLGHKFCHTINFKNVNSNKILMENILTLSEINTHLLSDDTILSSLQVTISTARVKNGGTDANVTLTIGGIEHDINNPNINNFEQGVTTNYLIQTNFTMGQLRKSQITLSHDNSGDKPGWNVGNVVLQTKPQNTDLFVVYKRWGDIGWLSVDDPLGTSVELQVGEANV